jgi:hypothetical protein
MGRCSCSQRRRLDVTLRRVHPFSYWVSLSLCCLSLYLIAIFLLDRSYCLIYLSMRSLLARSSSACKQEAMRSIKRYNKIWTSNPLSPLPEYIKHQRPSPLAIPHTRPPDCSAPTDCSASSQTPRSTDPPSRTVPHSAAVPPPSVWIQNRARPRHRRGAQRRSLRSIASLGAGRLGPRHHCRRLVRGGRFGQRRHGSWKRRGGEHDVVGERIGKESGRAKRRV